MTVVAWKEDSMLALQYVQSVYRVIGLIIIQTR
jgi:hypothetical protein